MFEIYVIRNAINNKVYVGQTKQGIQNRFNSHLNSEDDSAIHCAIRKYGKEHFYVEKICDCSSQEELNEKEIFYIKQFNSIAPSGYNLTTGGQQFEFTEEVKSKISKNTKIAMQYEEIREKCRKRPEGWLENVKKAMRTPEVIDKIRQSKAKRDIQQFRNRLSISVEERWKDPEYKEKQRIAKQNICKEELFQCSELGREFFRNKAHKEWSDPIYREKQKEARKENMYNDRWKQNISNATKDAMFSPKHRERYLRGYINYLIKRFENKSEKLAKFLDEYLLYNKKFRNYCKQAFNS